MESGEGGLSTGVTAHTEGDRGFPGNGRMLCRGSVRVPRGGDRGSPIAFRDKGSLGGKGVKSVARDDVGSGPASGCRGEGEREVGDLTLIEAGCREPLRGDQALFPRGMMSGGEMDLAWGNKPVEVPDPEDSSTMEESVVTFSGQRRKEPLVGDLVSLPEIVRSSMEKREDAVLGMDIYRLKRMGGREKAGLDPEDVSTGEAMGATLSGTGTPNPWWGTGPSHRRVLGRAWER